MKIQKILVRRAPVTVPIATPARTDPRHIQHRHHDHRTGRQQHTKNNTTTRTRSTGHVNILVSTSRRGSQPQGAAPRETRTETNPGHPVTSSRKSQTRRRFGLQPTGTSGGAPPPSSGHATAARSPNSTAGRRGRADADLALGGQSHTQPCQTAQIPNQSHIRVPPAHQSTHPSAVEHLGTCRTNGMQST